MDTHVQWGVRAASASSGLVSIVYFIPVFVAERVDEQSSTTGFDDAFSLSRIALGKCRHGLWRDGLILSDHRRDVIYIWSLHLTDRIPTGYGRQFCLWSGGQEKNIFSLSPFAP